MKAQWCSFHDIRVVTARDGVETTHGVPAAGHLDMWDGPNIHPMCKECLQAAFSAALTHAKSNR